MKFFVAVFEEELIWTTNEAKGTMAISMTSFAHRILTYVFTRRPSLITYEFALLLIIRSHWPRSFPRNLLYPHNFYKSARIEMTSIRY